MAAQEVEKGVVFSSSLPQSPYLTQIRITGQPCSADFIEPANSLRPSQEILLSGAIAHAVYHTRVNAVVTCQSHHKANHTIKLSVGWEDKRAIVLISQFS